MQGGIPGARWTDPQNFHITITFIGDTDEATAEIIDEILSDIKEPSFALQVQGIGIFSQGDDPTILWAGVKHEEKLFHLREKIDRAFDMARIRYENRKYTPHLTLARFRHNPDDGKIAEFNAAYGDLLLEPFDVREFVLYQSHLTKNGPFYDPLIRYPLI